MNFMSGGGELFSAGGGSSGLMTMSLSPSYAGRCQHTAVEKQDFASLHQHGIPRQHTVHSIDAINRVSATYQASRNTCADGFRPDAGGDGLAAPPSQAF